MFIQLFGFMEKLLVDCNGKYLGVVIDLFFVYVMQYVFFSRIKLIYIYNVIQLKIDFINIFN